VLAERCGYFRTMFAESSTVVGETPILSFDFTTVAQVTSFHHLLTYLYTDTCTLLSPGCRIVPTAVVDASDFSKIKRKVTVEDTAGTCVKSADVIDGSVMTLKTMARQFGVPSLVKR